ncbi:hypothetical protein M514_05124 [Trichuris suis]|uniref:Uncharacterized protein n=1 Tax=Trichuris suis TaxID=68888 RepID=A0A085MA59_9BILA|nr:hypothetical protein M513_05124 [Trichuris suis]KFD63028.1 hypothetical protein M514_05124 [Trichuris suis]
MDEKLKRVILLYEFKRRHGAEEAYAQLQYSTKFGKKCKPLNNMGFVSQLKRVVENPPIILVSPNDSPYTKLMSLEMAGNRSSDFSFLLGRTCSTSSVALFRFHAAVQGVHEALIVGFLSFALV